VALAIDEFGVYDMTITINGDAIKGSPFTLTVLKLFPPVQDVFARFGNTGTAGAYSRSRSAQLELSLCPT
jgi:hypothetical protein